LAPFGQPVKGIAMRNGDGGIDLSTSLEMGQDPIDFEIIAKQLLPLPIVQKSDLPLIGNLPTVGADQP
jgi:hypothetical protein